LEAEDLRTLERRPQTLNREGKGDPEVMTAKKIKKLLEQALLYDGEMHYSLYEYELEELLDYLKSSMEKDKDDYIFAVTENTGHVAMVLIEKSGEMYINEQAREKLKALWPAAYESNMKKLIPAFAKQLSKNEMPINGVKAVRRSRHLPAA
jgi:frataxin-like iron-binding protein CyaY